MLVRFVEVSTTSGSEVFGHDPARCTEASGFVS